MTKKFKSTYMLLISLKNLYTCSNDLFTLTYKLKFYKRKSNMWPTREGQKSMGAK